jgi:hypothetical protein
MKRTITAILFILVFSAPRLQADHIIGSDISYRCIRDSVFEVIYNFYRDCNGCFVLGQSPKCGTSENCNSSQTAPTSLSVIGSGTSCSRTLTLSMTRTSIIDITKTCASEKSRCAQPCNGSYPYGIEKHTFKGTLDLRQAMRWSLRARAERVAELERALLRVARHLVEKVGRRAAELHARQPVDVARARQILCTGERVESLREFTRTRVA